jgi:hypothetical protein
MKYVFEMSSGGMIHIPSLVSDVGILFGGYTDT